ncbi:hypothetical protein C3B58_14190 [Lactonifactor longoviformis]|uniref:Predicted TIM-barrel enzyme n=1 Tax=Lactonifactor longoviformis DSM 17459 TaxID=1122155 RepID=A0A1M4URE7_9CLOT|nr:phosphoenolpyruvate hydrolase family protein [Lactonifactor longoviformis]POP31940.1 hypothetical protein C3B58_14190 [Lactonifactor longoviformis]SHE59259.1 Predicted TIM-barrel enzyme [Lactonifactor longoviformis DSM 17459]
MDKYFSKKTIISLMEKLKTGCRPILVTTAGIGLSAKFEQRGNTDMIAVSSSSILEMDGHHPLISMLPYGNANEMVLKTVKRIVSQVADIPLMAGICATDPTTDLQTLLDELAFYKVSAIYNTPSVGIYEGEAKWQLEKAGVKYEDELAALVYASERGFYTMANVFTMEQAELAVQTNIDAVVCDLGFTISPEEDREEYLTEEYVVEKLQRLTRAVRAASADKIVFVHGGLINTPEAARHILPRTGAIGLVLDSAVERIPVEVPLMKAVQEFKNISLYSGKE